MLARGRQEAAGNRQHLSPRCEATGRLHTGLNLRSKERVLGGAKPSLCSLRASPPGLNLLRELWEDFLESILHIRRRDLQSHAAGKKQKAVDRFFGFRGGVASRTAVSVQTVAFFDHGVWQNGARGLSRPWFGVSARTIERWEPEFAPVMDAACRAGRTDTWCAGCDCHPRNERAGARGAGTDRHR